MGVASSKATRLHLSVGKCGQDQCAARIKCRNRSKHHLTAGKGGCVMSRLSCRTSNSSASYQKLLSAVGDDLCTGSQYFMYTSTRWEGKARNHSHRHVHASRMTTVYVDPMWFFVEGSRAIGWLALHGWPGELTNIHQALQLHHYDTCFMRYSENSALCTP